MSRPIPFVDVPETHPAREAVENVIEAGLMDLYCAKFQGNVIVTRYELAMVLDRLVKRGNQ